MSKSTGISTSAAAKPAPPPPSKNTSQPAPAKNTTKGKEAPKPDVPIDQGKKTPEPPSDDSKLSSFSNSNAINDSFSYSNEGYSSRKTTTESTTRLVDSLVETYTGEHSGIESHDHSFGRDKPSRMYSSGSESCPHSPGATRARFQRLDDAGQQLSQARQNVERVLDKAVEARIKDEKPVSPADEKRAEQEYERLTKAEGSLHRTRQTLAEKQEFRRQRKQEFKMQSRAAENALVAKYGDANAALRDYMLETFRPIISKDDKARTDLNHLQAAAEWHVKSDSKAARLAGENSEKSEPSKARVEKRRELKRRIEGEGFKEALRTAEDSERAQLAERELDKLGPEAPVDERRELESKLNEQLCQVQLKETKNSDKDDDKRRRSVDTLMKTKEQRAGKAGQELNPISEAVENLDAESVDKTHKTLEEMDLNSANSTLDLERIFGRNVGEVKTDLEQQVHRGGKSVTKARKTLKQLDKVVRRSRLLSEADGWDALLQCIAPSGPTLGGFLGISDGRNQGWGSPKLNSDSRVNFAAAGGLARRLARSGGRVDDERKAETLSRLGFVG